MNEVQAKLYYANYLLNTQQNEESYVIAFAMYKEVVVKKSSNAEVNYNLGYMYQYGLGTELNYKMSFHYYKYLIFTI